jgi:hypothetical protein
LIYNYQMNKIKKEEKNLLTDTIQICVENKIKMILIPQKTHKGIGGWVKEGEFGTCLDPSGNYETNWGIFVHESCHVDQMIDKNSIWYDESFNTEKDWLDLHTKGETKKSEKVKKYFKKIMELELDCEKRSVEKIKKYNLNIDINSYIKSGNSYLFSYYCFYHLKCWYHHKYRIYDQNHIIESMPCVHLSVDDYWTKHDVIYKFLKKYNNKN